MIGDWVRLRYKDCQTNEEIVKDFRVYQVREHCSVRYAWSKESGNMAMVTHIEPIPITPEILEKNGFVRSEKSSKKPYQIRNCSTYISVISGRVNARLIRGNGEPMNAVQVNCRYVHELQHALRLCGIEKEIVL